VLSSLILKAQSVLFHRRQAVVRSHPIRAQISRHGYPIPIEEWNHLKEKISSIRDRANIYHTIGSVLLGVAGSACLAALTMEGSTTPDKTAPLSSWIAWSIFIGALCCGGLALFFGKEQRKVQTAAASDVVAQMELIEKRYEVEKL